MPPEWSTMREAGGRPLKPSAFELAPRKPAVGELNSMMIVACGSPRRSAEDDTGLSRAQIIRLESCQHEIELF